MEFRNLKSLQYIKALTKDNCQALGNHQEHLLCMMLFSRERTSADSGDPHSGGGGKEVVMYIYIYVRSMRMEQTFSTSSRLHKLFYGM